MPENEFAPAQNINEPGFLTKAENPGLFEAVCRELHIDSESTQELSSDELYKVESLDLTPENSANVTSLNGIEKLGNLNSFMLYGIGEGNPSDLIYYDINPNMFDNIKANMLDAEKLETGMFKYNQVEDFSPLQNCSKLKSLYILNQHKVKNIDVGELPNLKILSVTSCENMSTISGLTRAMDNKELKYCAIKNCDNLRSFSNDTKFVNLLKDDNNIDCTLEPKYFINLMRDHPELRETMENMPDDKIKWIDMGANYSTKQMLMVHDRIADIVNTVCQEGENDIQKLANVYRYFCDTLTYNDHETTREEKDAHRRVFDVLFNNEGVCFGFSQIFNLCGEYLGFKMETCSCILKNKETEYKDERTVLKSNHAISRLKLFDKNKQEWGWRYCDITNDTLYKRSKFFLLNHGQITDTCQLTIISSPFQFEPDAPDLQKELEQNGLLETADRNKLPDVFLRKENPGLFDAACMELNVDPNEVEGLTQGDLDRINFLRLNAVIEDSSGNCQLGTDVRSLAGIEKFRELTDISISGTHSYQVYYLRKLNNLQKDQELELYERNQITDLSPLQNCPKLEFVLMSDQQKIDSLDVGKLKSVQYIHIYGCDSLREIQNAEEFNNSAQGKELVIKDCKNLQLLHNNTVQEEIQQTEQQAEQSQVVGLEQDDNLLEGGAYVTQMPQNVEVLAQGTQQEFGESVQNAGQDFSEQVQPVGEMVQENQSLVVGQEWGQTPNTQQPVEQTQGIEYQPVEQVFVEQPAEFTQDGEHIGDPNYTNYEEPTYYAPLEQVSQPPMQNDANAYNYQYADYNNANYQNANNSLGQGGVQMPTAEQMQADGNGQGAGNSVAQEESMVR